MDINKGIGTAVKNAIDPPNIGGDILKMNNLADNIVGKNTCGLLIYYTIYIFN